MSLKTPALFTKISTRPKAAIVSSTSFFTPALSVTLDPLEIASPPMAFISSTTLSAASLDPPVPSTEPPKSFTTTLAPLFANSNA